MIGTYILREDGIDTRHKGDEPNKKQALQQMKQQDVQLLCNGLPTYDVYTLTKRLINVSALVIFLTKWNMLYWTNQSKPKHKKGKGEICSVQL